MSQESLHSLGDSEVMLGVRPKDKHLEVPEQLEATWESPSSRLETMICNLVKSTQSIQQQMAETKHSLQQSMTEQMYTHSLTTIHSNDDVTKSTHTQISTTHNYPNTTNKTTPSRS